MIFLKKECAREVEWFIKMLLGSILNLCFLSSTILLQSSSADQHGEFTLMRHFYNVCIFKDYLLAFVLTLRFSKPLHNHSCIQDTTASGRGSSSGHIILLTGKVFLPIHISASYVIMHLVVWDWIWNNPSTSHIRSKSNPQISFVPKSTIHGGCNRAHSWMHYYLCLQSNGKKKKYHPE